MQITNIISNRNPCENRRHDNSPPPPPPPPPPDKSHPGISHPDKSHPEKRPPNIRQKPPQSKKVKVILTTLLYSL